MGFAVVWLILDAGAAAVMYAESHAKRPADAVAWAVGVFAAGLLGLVNIFVGLAAPTLVFVAYSISLPKSQRVCPNCGRRPEPADRVCRYCGAALNREAPTKRCPNCGQTFGREAAFCSRCGTKLEPAGAVAQVGGSGAPDGVEAKDLPPSIVLCPKCGRRNFKGDAYCYHCDAPLKP